IECLVWLCDFLYRQPAQALQTKGFDAKTGQHASVDHCFAQIVEVHVFYCACEISGHAASERVPCPGWIMDVLKWVRATAEELISFTEEQRAVLAFLYGNVRRHHILNSTSGLD